MGYYGRGSGQIQILRNKNMQLVGINMQGGHHAEQEYFEGEAPELENQSFEDTIVKDSKDICMVKTEDGRIIVFSGDSEHEYTTEEIQGILNDINYHKNDDRAILENSGASDFDLMLNMKKDLEILESDRPQEEKDILLSDRKSIYGTWEKGGKFAMVSQNEQGAKDLAELFENIERGNVSVSTNPYVNNENYNNPRSMSFTIVDRLKEMKKEEQEIEPKETYEENDKKDLTQEEIENAVEIDNYSDADSKLSSRIDAMNHPEEQDEKYEKNSTKKGEIFISDDENKKGEYAIGDFFQNDGYKDVFEFYSLDGKDKSLGYLSYFERTGKSISPEEVDKLKEQVEKYEHEQHEKEQKESDFQEMTDEELKEIFGNETPQKESLFKIASRQTKKAIDKISSLFKSRIKDYKEKSQDEPNKDENDIDIN